MTQKDKELLLKDLTARLPYGVKVQDELGRVNKLTIGNADLIRLFYNDFSIYGEKALSLPLLHPLSSMTEEERKELEKITHHTFEYKKGERDIWTKSYHSCHLFNGAGELYGAGEPINMPCSNELCTKLIDWLNMHHFDYRHLIEKGLALEAPEGMYNMKDK